MSFYYYPVRTESIAKLLRVLRKRRLLTQEQLAEASGVNRVNISQYESGQVIPSAGQLNKLLTVLRADLMIRTECRLKRIIA